MTKYEITITAKDGSKQTYERLCENIFHAWEFAEAITFEGERAEVKQA